MRLVVTPKVHTILVVDDDGRLGAMAYTTSSRAEPVDCSLDDDECMARLVELLLVAATRGQKAAVGEERMRELREIISALLRGLRGDPRENWARLVEVARRLRR
jgi:hypothetical protein